MKKTAILTFLLILFCTILSFSVNAQAFKPKEVVKWTEKHSIPANAKVGDVVTLSYSCTIKEGFHLYSSQQPSKAALPLEFILDKEVKGVELVGKVIDGPGKKTEHDDVFDADISFYEKNASFSQKVKITAENPTIGGHLRYQVCDENMCLPDNYEFKVPVKATGGAKTTDATAATSTAKTPEDAAKKKADEAKKADSLKKVQEASLNQTETGDAGILDGIHWAGVKVSPDGSQKVKAGDIITLSFKALIDPGVKYIASLSPKGAAAQGASFDLDPTESKNLEEVGDLTITGTKKTGKDNYQDSITVTQQLKVTADNPVLRGYLSYIGGEDEKTAAGKQEIPSFSWAQEKTEVGVTTPIQDDGTCNLWALILLGLSFGFGAVATPCFYPMIPLTVSYFTKQSGTRARGVFNAIFYGLSIIFMFTGVAVLLTAIFGPEVLHQVSTNAWTNLVLFVIIFAFGLSFLGLFDITLPSGFVNAISQKGNTSSLSGIFFMAATLVLVSFSCTGTFVAPLLSQAAAGGSWICIIVPMLAFSIALAFPFIVLALFPSLIQSMPKSGSWLGTFKITLGFLEIALSFMYLSNADLVKHWHILPRSLFLSVWIGIAALLGLYLIGKIHIKKDEIPAEGISVPRLMFGLFFITLGLYMFSSLPDKPIKLFDSLAMLPPAENKTICEQPDKKYAYLSSETPEGLCAFYDLEQGLEYAKKVNKPVLLDFTGHTCKNCRQVEQTIWTDLSVARMLQNDYVLISLFTDDAADLDAVEVSPTGMKMYTLGDKWRDYENRIYGFIAQPYYVLLDHDKSSLVKPWGYSDAPTVTAYKKNLDAGLAEFKKRHGK
jgi:thiol:disulfide interchange protein